MEYHYDPMTGRVYSNCLDYDEARIAGMTAPVRCGFCSQAYDLGKVDVLARYADCSVWRTPCCNQQADDRGETGWKSHQDYRRIEKRRKSA